MQNVITAKQAREITRGRTPLIPVQYETACRALAECVSLDDAKLWSDKAEALASWAKIYRDDTASIEAKRLKLRAFRRMGELARELKPGGFAFGRTGAIKGAKSLLVESGLSESGADACRSLAKLSPPVFERLVNLPRPPAPVTFHVKTGRYAGKTNAFSTLMRSGDRSLGAFAAWSKTVDAAELAKELLQDERLAVNAAIVQAMEWLDTLERHLKL